MKRALTWIRNLLTRRLKVPRWYTVSWDPARPGSEQTIITLSKVEWDELKLKQYSFEIALRRCQKTLMDAANLGALVHQIEKRKAQGNSLLKTQGAMLSVHANQVLNEIQAIVPAATRDRVQA